MPECVPASGISTFLFVRDSSVLWIKNRSQVGLCPVLMDDLGDQEKSLSISGSELIKWNHATCLLDAWRLKKNSTFPAHSTWGVKIKHLGEYSAWNREGAGHLMIFCELFDLFFLFSLSYLTPMFSVQQKEQILLKISCVCWSWQVHNILVVKSYTLNLHTSRLGFYINSIIVLQHSFPAGTWAQGSDFPSPRSATH